MIKIIGKEQILDLFRKLNVEYLYNYKIEYSKIIGINCYKSPYYLDNKSEFINLDKVYGDFIRKRIISKVYISETTTKGYGLFALENIPKNSFIGVYLGVIREEDEMVNFDDSGYDTDYAWDYPDEIEDFPQLEINAKYAGNELRFANHDKNPNIRVEHTVIDNEWFIFFVADKNIKSNEELTISYGDAYWETEYRNLS